MALIKNISVRAGDMAQVVEHLPSKHEALSTILNSTTKKKKEDNFKRSKSS
jgi:hypothetical protein